MEGHYIGVVWTEGEGKERGYGRDRWADLVVAQTGTRAKDLPGILRPGRVWGHKEKEGTSEERSIAQKALWSL